MCQHTQADFSFLFFFLYKTSCSQSICSIFRPNILPRQPLASLSFRREGLRTAQIVFMYTGKDKQFLQNFTSDNNKKRQTDKKNKNKILRAVNFCTSLSFDHSFSCWVFCTTSISLVSHSPNINPNAETAELHLKVGGKNG